MDLCWVEIVSFFTWCNSEKNVHLNTLALVSLFAPNCFFFFCFLFLYENTSVICGDVKKKHAYFHANMVDMTLMETRGCSRSRCRASKCLFPLFCSDVRGYCKGWESSRWTALGGYSMPKHHTTCDELKEDGPDTEVQQDLPHVGTSRGRFISIKVKQLSKKWLNYL